MKGILKMKKILTAILALALCASVAVAASGCGCEKSKKTAKNTTSTSSGPGYKVEPTSPDFEEGEFGFYRLNDNEVKVTVYNGNAKNIEIPETANGAKVTVVGANLFQASDIETVKIPDTVTEIQQHAFSSCQNLTEVNLPEGLKVIGENAFWNCRKLENIELPASLKKIGWYAFSATGVKSLTIPESDTLSTLNEKIFFQCASLSEVTIPITVTNIADDTFEQCADGLKIKAYTGSYAVSYAKNHNFALEEMPRS